MKLNQTTIALLLVVSSEMLIAVLTPKKEMKICGILVEQEP